MRSDDACPISHQPEPYRVWMISDWALLPIETRVQSVSRMSSQQTDEKSYREVSLIFSNIPGQAEL
jgi:hypothetical protein